MAKFTLRDYVDKLSELPPDAPCEDPNGHKLHTVAQVRARIAFGDMNSPVETLPWLRDDGVVVTG